VKQTLKNEPPFSGNPDNRVRIVHVVQGKRLFGWDGDVFCSLPRPNSERERRREEESTCCAKKANKTSNERKKL